MNFTLSLPEWIAGEIKHLPSHLKSVEERMKTVIRFARLNFERETGGPFAAGVFERDTGKLLTIGVNRVMPSNCSSAHAEVMALSVAQKMLGTFDLGGPGMPAVELVVNWAPCVMCFGATLWSGVRSLVIAGSGPEIEKITGFDEGPLHPEWRKELAQRGIDFQEGVLREESLEVFRKFAASGAPVYNGRQG